jgi:wyosine [tRNA(Phe)-imidazoG37] synthetase (radical SAM superfamily)
MLTAIMLKPTRKPIDPVFGPFDSRRLGRSLGINPLPEGPKRCTFECVYCECGEDVHAASSGDRMEFPTMEQIRSALSRAAETFPCDKSDALDSLTIAGNGEPTLFPDIGELVDAVVDARDCHWPTARTVILTNGTLLHRPDVRRALARLDKRILKLDAGTDRMMDQLNRPTAKLTVDSLVKRLEMVDDIAIQSMFVKGTVDNTSDDQLEQWMGWIQRIMPVEVQIYSIDRLPAVPLEPVAGPELERIARHVRDVCGVSAVAY